MRRCWGSSSRTWHGRATRPRGTCFCTQLILQMPRRFCVMCCCGCMSAARRHASTGIGNNRHVIVPALMCSDHLLAAPECVYHAGAWPSHKLSSQHLNASTSGLQVGDGGDTDGCQRCSGGVAAAGCGKAAGRMHTAGEPGKRIRKEQAFLQSPLVAIMR